MGYDGNRNEQVVTTGAGFSGNLLPGKIAPFVHVDAGFASVNPASDGILPYNGFFVDGGVGLYVRIRNFCALAISPDYRFINAYQSYFGLQDQIHGYYGWQKDEVFNHQVGIRLAAVFY